jgi:hypothetical protein
MAKQFYDICAVSADLHLITLVFRNGARYEYYIRDGYELAVDTFTSIKRYSPGRALAWLKKRATEVHRLHDVTTEDGMTFTSRKRTPANPARSYWVVDTGVYKRWGPYPNKKAAEIAHTQVRKAFGRGVGSVVGEHESSWNLYDRLPQDYSLGSRSVHAA